MITRDIDTEDVNLIRESVQASSGALRNLFGTRVNHGSLPHFGSIGKKLDLSEGKFYLKIRTLGSAIHIILDTLAKAAAGMKVRKLMDRRAWAERETWINTLAYGEPPYLSLDIPVVIRAYREPFVTGWDFILQNKQTFSEDEWGKTSAKMLDSLTELHKAGVYHGEPTISNCLYHDGVFTWLDFETLYRPGLIAAEMAARDYMIFILSLANQMEGEDLLTQLVPALVRRIDDRDILTALKNLKVRRPGLIYYRAVCGYLNRKKYRFLRELIHNTISNHDAGN